MNPSLTILVVFLQSNSTRIRERKGEGREKDIYGEREREEEEIERLTLHPILLLNLTLEDLTLFRDLILGCAPVATNIPFQ